MRHALGAPHPSLAICTCQMPSTMVVRPHRLASLLDVLRRRNELCEQWDRAPALVRALYVGRSWVRHPRPPVAEAASWSFGFQRPRGSTEYCSGGHPLHCKRSKRKASLVPEAAKATLTSRCHTLALTGSCFLPMQVLIISSRSNHSEARSAAARHAASDEVLRAAASHCVGASCHCPAQWPWHLPPLLLWPTHTGSAPPPPPSDVPTVVSHCGGNT